MQFCYCHLHFPLYMYLDDWKSIIGDPTKFGFGVLTVFFAGILLFQHLLYGANKSNQNSKENSHSKNDTQDSQKEEIGIRLI